MNRVTKWAALALAVAGLPTWTLAAEPESVKIAFLGPVDAQLAWSAGTTGRFDSRPVICPATCVLSAGTTYRLRLSSIPNRPGKELYATLEVSAVTPPTRTYLANNAIPVSFNKYDIDRILAGKSATNVICFPDENHQDPRSPGVETLLGARMAPSVDPIAEAKRRGAILAIVRMGAKEDKPAAGPR